MVKLSHDFADFKGDQILPGAKSDFILQNDSKLSCNGNYHTNVNDTILFFKKHISPITTGLIIDKAIVAICFVK